MKTAKTTKIGADVLAVLQRLEWDGANARFGQIDRALYLRVNEVLEALGGKWTRGAKAHVFASADARAALEDLLEIGEFTSARDLRRTFGEFQTPEDLASELADSALLNKVHRVLEPSAGGGRLVRAIRKSSYGGPPHITAVEAQPKFEAGLRKIADEVHCPVDFLAWAREFKATGQWFDRVVMNPPFGGQVEIDHVLAAFDLLKPPAGLSAGILVAILPCSVMTRENRKGQEFRTLFARAQGKVVDNADDAFGTEGTLVRTVRVTLLKGMNFR